MDIFETEFNVGDEVFSTLHGWGEVVDYDANSDYPVHVATTSKYKNSKLTLEYTSDGRNFRDEDKSLFHSKEEAVQFIVSISKPEKQFSPLTFDFIKDNCIIGETVFFSLGVAEYEFTYFGFTLSGWLVTEDTHTAYDSELHGLQFWDESTIKRRMMVIK